MRTFAAVLVATVASLPTACDRGPMPVVSQPPSSTDKSEKGVQPAAIQVEDTQEYRESLAMEPVAARVLAIAAGDQPQIVTALNGRWVKVSGVVSEIRINDFNQRPQLVLDQQRGEKHIVLCEMHGDRTADAVRKGDAVVVVAVADGISFGRVRFSHGRLVTVPPAKEKGWAPIEQPKPKEKAPSAGVTRIDFTTRKVGDKDVQYLHIYWKNYGEAPARYLCVSWKVYDAKGKVIDTKDNIVVYQTSAQSDGIMPGKTNDTHEGYPLTGVQEEADRAEVTVVECTSIGR